MSDVPVPVPPVLNAGLTAASSPPPPPADPAQQAPIDGLIATVEALLRQPQRVVSGLQQGASGPLIGRMLFIGCFCSLVYGFVMGTFSGHEQLWAAPVKVAGGLFTAAFICLPSLYIFSCLGGARASLQEVSGLIAGLAAILTLLLIGFAPVAWIFSQSTESIPAMGALHLLFCTVATWFGLRFLRVGFVRLGGSPAGLRTWTVVFLLVLLQMTAALRPLVGRDDSFLPGQKTKKFFVTHWVESLKQ
jgi:hypothetical protein